MCSVKMRQLVEKEITTAVVDVLLKAGYAISIDNGDNSGMDYELENSTNRKAILKKLYQTDEDYLYVRHKYGRTGYVFFVYGNDGWDVISDYSVNLERFISKGPVAKVVKKYED